MTGRSLPAQHRPARHPACVALAMAAGLGSAAQADMATIEAAFVDRCVTPMLAGDAPVMDGLAFEPSVPEKIADQFKERGLPVPGTWHAPTYTASVSGRTRTTCMIAFDLGEGVPSADRVASAAEGHWCAVTDGLPAQMRWLRESGTDVAADGHIVIGLVADGSGQFALSALESAIPVCGDT